MSKGMNAGIAKTMVPHTQGYSVGGFPRLTISAYMMDFHGGVGVSNSILPAQYAPQSCQSSIVLFFFSSHLTNVLQGLVQLPFKHNPVLNQIAAQNMQIYLSFVGLTNIFVALLGVHTYTHE